VDCQKTHAGIGKHGGGMRKMLSSKGKEEKVWKLEKRKIDRGMEEVQEE